MAMTLQPRQQTLLIACVLLLPCAYLYCSQRTANSKGKTVELRDVTYESLLAYDPANRMIVAAKCNGTSLSFKGSRSQRITLDTQIVAGPGKGKPFQFAGFWQQKPVYTVGKIYLVAAYKGEFLPAWNLVEAVEISPDQAESAVQSATAELQRRSAAQK
jgi:hypothetical protein